MQSAEESEQADRFVFVDDLDTLEVALDTLRDCETVSFDAEGAAVSVCRELERVAFLHWASCPSADPVEGRFGHGFWVRSATMRHLQPGLVTVDALTGLQVGALCAPPFPRGGRPEPSHPPSPTHKGPQARWRAYAGTYLSRYGKLCVIQIGVPRWLPLPEDVYVIDIVALGAQVRAQELRSP